MAEMQEKGRARALSTYKRGNVWWYKFVWRGETIRESTKQGNKRVAEQMEAAWKTQLAKGEVGIKDRKPCPTLEHFLFDSFMPFIEATKAQRPNTVSFYRACANNLIASDIGSLKLDKIKAESITAYIELRKTEEVATATINRELSTLRRALRLANKWGKLELAPPEITLLDGENVRERVLTSEEEYAYLDAAAPLRRTFATTMIDCGLRPDEVYRLRWDENYRDGRIIIHKGKTKAARRSVPITPRLAALLEMKSADRGSEWIFPAATKTGT